MSGKLLLFISSIKSNKWDAFSIIFGMFDVKGVQRLSLNRDKFSIAVLHLVLNNLTGMSDLRVSERVELLPGCVS